MNLARTAASAMVSLVVTSVVIAGFLPTRAPAAPAPQAAPSFSEDFTGNPANPQPWRRDDWDVQTHSRDTNTWDQLEPMQHQHGPDCSPPGHDGNVTHGPQTDYAHAVFGCRDHVMTSLNASGYGVIYLQPPAMLDFSAGEAVLKFDLTTLRTSSRDWWDVWVTPYNDQLALPLRADLPDLAGPPKRAVRIDGGHTFNGESPIKAGVYRDGNLQDIPPREWLTIEGALRAAGQTPSAQTRTGFELRLSRTRVKFGIPSLNYWPVDDAIADLGWTTGVVQLGHHSYTPLKDCGGGWQGKPCRPSTWHWDNVAISPAVPYTIVRGNERTADDPADAVTFPAGAPEGAVVRFAAIGAGIQVSDDGGASWQDAEKPKEGPPEHFASYRAAVEPGTTELRFRGTGNGWRVKDASLMAEGRPAAPGPTRTRTPTRTPTPSPTVAVTRTPTAGPATATSVPATAVPGTATPEPTAAPSATTVPATAVPPSATPVPATPLPATATATRTPEARSVCVDALLVGGSWRYLNPEDCVPPEREPTP